MSETTLIFKASNLNRIASAMSKLLSRDYHVLIVTDYFIDWVEDGLVKLNDDTYSIIVSDIDDNIRELCEASVAKTNRSSNISKLGRLSLTISEPDVINFKSIAEQFKC